MVSLLLTKKGAHRAPSRTTPTSPALRIRGNLRLDQRLAVDHLVAVDLQTAQDLAEGEFRPQGLDLADLAGERQTVRMAGEERPLTRVEVRAVRTVIRKQVGDIDREAVDHAQPAVAQHGDAVAGQVGLTEFRLLDHAASPSRHHDPTTLFRDVLLVQDLAHTHQDVQKLDVGSTRVAAHDAQGRALHTEVHVAGDDTRGGTAVVGAHLAHDAVQNVLVAGDLKLLSGVIRPHRQDVEVRLDLHHIVENGREVLAVADVQLNAAAGRAVQVEKTVRLIVADGDGRLRADLDAIAVILDLAFVIRVADRSKDRGGVELLDQLRAPNLRDETRRLERVAGRAYRGDRRRRA